MTEEQTQVVAKPALYVGTYAKYNNGSIAGKWLYLEDYADADAFLTACKELHKDEYDPEFMYQDFENFPKSYYSEAMGHADLVKLYEWLHGPARTLYQHKDDAEMLKRIVIEVNSWNEELDAYQAYEFDDEFFDIHFAGKPLEAARAVFFGNVQNWQDEYIRFNGYGNLESLSDYAYEKELVENGDEIIAAALDNKDNIDLDYITEGLEASA